MAFWSKDKGEKEAPLDPSAYVARKEYPKAIAAYRAQISAQPKNYVLRHKVADVLCLAGREKDSLADYSAAADGYQEEGFLIKAIAILKKMQKLDPGNASVEARLTKLSVLGSSASAAVASPLLDLSSRAGEDDGRDELSLDMEAIDDQPSIPVAPMDEGPSPPGPANLLATPLFSDLTPDEMKGMIGRLRHRDFAAGTVLVTEGEPGDSLFVLSQGRVRVTTRGPKGKAVDLAELKEGDFFGEVSLLTGRPRTATITSLEDTEVLELNREDLVELERTHPRVTAVIREFYEKRVASTVEAMIQAARPPKPTSRG
ncbi:MAG: cyclic nucleotide-binding domain-containing protein [Acidobacteria bacterium]|nr:cyclic nucleotide-binding domain-containing protein [Acidobacteriota bacterium]